MSEIFDILVLPGDGIGVEVVPVAQAVMEAAAVLDGVRLRFAEALKTVPVTIRLGLYEDETSALCQWHLPEAHSYESWGDVRAYIDSEKGEARDHEEVVGTDVAWSRGDRNPEAEKGKHYDGGIPGQGHPDSSRMPQP